MSRRLGFSVCAVVSVGDPRQPCLLVPSTTQRLFEPYFNSKAPFDPCLIPSTTVLAPSQRLLKAMAEKQPPNVVEGATTGDVEDEIKEVPKNAEDRKAAAALSSLDSREDDSATGKNVDQEAVRKAISQLAGPSAASSDSKKAGSEKKEVKKVVKVDQADVALVVCRSPITEILCASIMLF